MKKILLFLFFISNYSFLIAQNTDSVIVLDDKDDLFLVGKQTYYFEDSEAKMSFDEVRKADKEGKFTLHDKEVFARPATPSAFWFKIMVKNKSEEDAWLEIGTTFAWYIDFYAPDSIGNYNKVYLTGTMRPNSEKYYDNDNCFWLPLNRIQDQQTKTYYIRITEEFPFEVPLQVGTIRSLSKNNKINGYLTAGYAGLMIIMILYNGFIYVSTKENIYGVYVLFLIGLLYGLPLLNNYCLFPYRDIMHRLFIFITPYTPQGLVGIFCIKYLNLRNTAPKFEIAIIVILILMCIETSVLSLVGVRMVYLVTIYQLILIVLYIVCISVGIYLIRVKKQKQARYYVLGWTFYMISITVFLGVVNGLIQFNPYTRNITYFGSALEVWMFSLALADRINIMKKEKESALLEKQNSQIKLLQKSRENEKLIRDQNKMLAEKVEEKTLDLQERNHELSLYRSKMTSSIRSAYTIQQAILPPKAKLDEILGEYFIIYHPKDQVSGDFYWVNQIGSKKFLIVADCTGHGVSGAFMTMIGNTLLDKIIKVWDIYDPAQILETTHTEIQAVLQQNETGNTDGMDVAVAVLEENPQGFKVEFSGAKRPMYYIEAGKTEAQKLLGFRKMVGGFTNEKKYYQTENTILTKGSMIYMASDGYTDQNDQERKSFSEKRFMRMLSVIQEKTLVKQKIFFEETLDQHMAGAEQRDDILVVGVRI